MSSILKRQLLNVMFHKTLSTLGPLLCLLYIKNIANTTMNSIVHHFADNNNLIYGNENPFEIFHVMGNELSCSTDSIRTNKLSLIVNS